jgi:hypothetical protein
MRTIFLLLFLPFFVCAQIDSALTVPLVGINFGGQLPSGELVKRFGPNLRAGGSFLLKTKKNWVVGIESNYNFGRNVKEDVLAQMKNSDGNVIDNEGFPADVRISQRGVVVHAVFGRVFKFFSSNPNSGLMVNIGAGYMQHKIHIYDAQQKIAAVRGDLKKGYDRLTSGPSTCQFIGYLFLSENKLLNFYMGIESYQGFTKSVRKLNYDTGLRDLNERLDITTGIRVGWILPLYKRKPNDFYYN